MRRPPAGVEANALMCVSEAPNNAEKVQVLRRAMRRIDRDLDTHHRARPNPHLDRDRDVLETIVDEYMDRCRS